MGHSRYSGSNSRFHPEANDDYRVVSEKDLTLKKLNQLVKHHRDFQRPRLVELEDYYKGDNREILKRSSRRKNPEDADHRATHNFARYVSTFIQGYLAGVPIRVEHTTKATQESIRKNDQVNDAEGLNSDLILDCSVFGRAYELFYRNFDDNNRVSRSDPKNTFVIYDTTVDKRPVAAVRYVEYRDDNGQGRLFATVYTATSETEYKSDNPTDIDFKEEDTRKHYWQTVPVNEYRNNRYRQGDFEPVLNLIDLYDSAQSDIANYMTDLNDALLKITGNIEMSVDDAKKQRSANLMLLKPPIDVDGKEGSADADFIYKKYDVNGVESYKERLETDIHKFTNTPNLNDSHFANQQSGEAMKYKLFGLEQVRAAKERLFRQSMRRRYRIFSGMGETARDKTSININHVDDIEIIFTPNLPRTMSEEIEAFEKLGGELSQHTLLGLLSMIQDPEAEHQRVQEERQSQLSDPYGNEGGT
nr:phage portal protein [Alkalicoccus luteus]